MLRIRELRSQLITSPRLPGSDRRKIQSEALTRLRTEALQNGDGNASERRCSRRANTGFRGVERLTPVKLWGRGESHRTRCLCRLDAPRKRMRAPPGRGKDTGEAPHPAPPSPVL